MDLHDRLLTSSGFNAEAYMIERYGDFTFSEMREEIHDISDQLGSVSQQLNQLVKDELNMFITCQDKIVELNSTQNIFTGNAITKIGEKYAQLLERSGAAFGSLLKDDDEVRKLDKVLSVVERYKVYFRIPSQIKRYINSSSWGYVIKEYKKAKYLISKAEVAGRVVKDTPPKKPRKQDPKTQPVSFSDDETTQFHLVVKLAKEQGVEKRFLNRIALETYELISSVRKHFIGILEHTRFSAVDELEEVLCMLTDLDCEQDPSILFVRCVEKAASTTLMTIRKYYFDESFVKTDRRVCVQQFCDVLSKYIPQFGLLFKRVGKETLANAIVESMNAILSSVLKHFHELWSKERRQSLTVMDEDDQIFDESRGEWAAGIGSLATCFESTGNELLVSFSTEPQVSSRISVYVTKETDKLRRYLISQSFIHCINRISLLRQMMATEQKWQMFTVVGIDGTSQQETHWCTQVPIQFESIVQQFVTWVTQDQRTCCLADDIATAVIECHICLLDEFDDISSQISKRLYSSKSTSSDKAFSIPDYVPSSFEDFDGINYSGLLASCSPNNLLAIVADLYILQQVSMKTILHSLKSQLRRGESPLPRVLITDEDDNKTPKAFGRAAGAAAIAYVCTTHSEKNVIYLSNLFESMISIQIQFYVSSALLHVRNVIISRAFTCPEIPYELQDDPSSVRSYVFSIVLRIMSTYNHVERIVKVGQKMCLQGVINGLVEGIVLIYIHFSSTMLPTLKPSVLSTAVLQLEGEVEFLQKCLEPLKVPSTTFNDFYRALRSLSVEDRSKDSDLKAKIKQKMIATALSKCKLLTECWKDVFA